VRDCGAVRCFLSVAQFELSARFLPYAIDAATVACDDDVMHMLAHMQLCEEDELLQAVSLGHQAASVDATPASLRIRFGDPVRRLRSCPYAAALIDDMAHMRHLLWRTVPLRYASPCCIDVDKKADKALQSRMMPLMHAVKFVPSAATASESDAAAWLMANPKASIR
jgi:hypothetical protein